MYKKAEKVETELEDFELPFGGKLSEDNRLSFSQGDK
jgi:hypothetical protein